MDLMINVSVSFIHNIAYIQ